MNLARLVERNAKTYGDRPALSLGDRLVETHASLALRCQAVAAHLRLNLRLTPGDKVALAMANVPDIWPALFGIWWAGLTAVPMNEKLHAKEFDWILKDSGARACFASPGLAEPIASVFDAGQVIAEAGFPEADFPVVPTFAGDKGLAVLHLGNHGAAKGRDTQPSQSNDDDPFVFLRHRPCRAWRLHPPRGARHSWLWNVGSGSHRWRGGKRISRKCRIRPPRNSGAE